MGKYSIPLPTFRGQGQQIKQTRPDKPIPRRCEWNWYRKTKNQLKKTTKLEDPQTNLRRPHPFCLESLPNGVQNPSKKELTKTRKLTIAKPCQTNLRRPRPFCLESLPNGVQNSFKKELTKTRKFKSCSGNLRRPIKSKTLDSHTPAPDDRIGPILMHFTMFYAHHAHKVT